MTARAAGSATAERPACAALGLGDVDRAIGERLLDPAAAARLREAFTALCERLGPDETQVQQEALRLRAEPKECS